MAQIPVSDEGRTIYNSIMGSIEPDLLYENLAKLQDIAVSDTGEQRAARLKRYTAAYAAYEEKYKLFLSAKQAEWMTKRKVARLENENEYASLTNSVVSDLEKAIEHLSPSSDDKHP